MPNPAGTNQFKGREPAYGAVKQLGTLTRQAPLSGAPVPDRAKQAQRRAVHRTPPQASVSAPQAPLPPAAPSYHAQLAVVYQELAAHTSDPVVHEYALLAARQAAQ